ncbi:MAG: hypothetical protein NC321_10525 [Clostridium sp.]|nr:hypothetical protein [Clostridium sp.]
MWKDKQLQIDDDNNLNESVYHNYEEIIGGRTANFSVEPSNEKDYDIYLMTGNNSEKGSEKK